MRGSIVGVLALVASLSLPVFGQNAATRPKRPKQPPVPYRAEYRRTMVSTLANGTTITLESSEVLASDSQGRTMSSNTDFSRGPNGELFTRVVVSDPVAGTQTSWTSPGTRATVTVQPPHPPDIDCYVFYETPAAPTSGPTSDSDTAEPARSVVGKPVGATRKSSSDPDMNRAWQKPVFTTVVEDLGTTTIEGVEARGKRITRTTPPGAAGNDQPLVSTDEDWTAWSNTTHFLLLRNVSDDPLFGKSTFEVTNLSLEEPDISTFRPPEGYEIVTLLMHTAPCPKELKSEQ